MKNELDEPLGVGVHAGNDRRARSSGRMIGASILVLAVAGTAAFVWFPRDGLGFRPHAVARIEKVEQSSIISPEPQPQSEREVNVRLAGESGARAGSLAHIADSGEIERQSGVKVTRAGDSEIPGALIIRLDRPAGLRLPPAPDRRLIETGRYGPIPKISADGATAREVYARPVSLSSKLKADAPKIALVVGGVGLKPALTASAIDELPEAVSLALAPYGSSLEADAARARERGHEILLQAPMEPFDYPQNDPGPHTLLASAPASRALDDLHWLMSRFTGYVGIVNFLGARFTADEKALTPALADIAARGLMFLDDGTSPQSLASSIAPRFMLPSARADIVLDAKATPEAIDAALARLEALARQNGKAIGFASALPSTIARLSRFTRDMERRGLALVPVTALATAPSASQTGSSK